jgi:hypothetical protein
VARARFSEFSEVRMPSATAKVYLIGQGSGQRDHAKAGLLFPWDGQFRIVSGISGITRERRSGDG